MLSRKNRVLSAGRHFFRPGTAPGEAPRPEAERLYRRLCQDLERTNLRGLVSSILDAPFYGMSVLELIWQGSDDGWWRLADVLARPYHWFAFDESNRPLFKGTDRAFAARPGFESAARLLPPGKFVIAAHHATYDNPYGLRLLSRCLWPVAFKRGGLRFYAKFVERHGLPWVIGTAPPRSTRDEKKSMAQDLARMVQSCVAALPSGADVKFLNPSSGADSLHESFIARQDRAISKLLMGQTLTVEMEGKNSQAAASTHDSVAAGLADADKAMVADAFNELAWLYARVNAGPDVPAPVFAFEEAENMLARAELDKTLHELGVEFTPEHFSACYALKPSEFYMRRTEQGEE